MIKTEALWLDGKSPLGVKGELSYHGNELIFQSHQTHPPTKLTLSLSSLSEITQRGPTWVVNFGKNRKGNYQHVFEVRNSDFIAQITGKSRVRTALRSRERFQFISKLPSGIRIVGAIFCIALLFQGYRFAAEHLYRIVPERYDTSIGNLAYNSMVSHLNVCSDSDVNKAIQAMLVELKLPDDQFSYTVTVVRDPMQNAFALPGGRIVIMSGLLEHSADPGDLLGVLAHEIAHVENRHGMKQLCRSLGTLLAVKMVVGAGFEEVELAETFSEVAATLTLLSYSRDLEREADLSGASRLHKNGFSHSGLIQFLRNTMLEESKKQETGSSKSSLTEWFSTHPNSEERIQALENLDPPAKSTNTIEFGTPWSNLKNRCK